MYDLLQPLAALRGQSRRFHWILLVLAVGTLSGCQAVQAGHEPTIAPAVVATPAVDFGAVVVGRSKRFDASMSNPSGAAVTVTAIEVDHAEFQIVSPQFPLTLGGGQSVPLSVSFTPKKSGAVQAGLVITSSAVQSVNNIPLSGTGVMPGELSLNPTHLNFDATLLGKSQVKSETLSNNGETSLQITQLTASNAEFSLSGTGLPVVLPPKSSTKIDVTFTPGARGPRSGSIAVTALASMVAGDTGSTFTTSDTETDTASIPAAGRGATPGQLAASQASLTFTDVQVGNSQSSAVT
ncbi:MAG TPA: choice-of-anchor D domain-containing protein, partial [Terriglobales bacterium]